MRGALIGWFRRSPGALAAIAVWTLAFAAAPCANAQTSEQRDVEAAYDAAVAAMTPGPGMIKLLDQATIQIGPEDAFVPRAQAVRLMNAMGNGASPGMLGLVLPRNGNWTWFITVSFEKLGFTPPGTLAKFDKDTIYDLMRRAATRGNEHRAERGSGRLDLVGFVEPPVYDPGHDRMFMATRIIQSGDGDVDRINLDAYVFGRDGVLDLELATHAGGYVNLRRHMDQIYYGAAFVPGKKSADVTPADKRMEYPFEMLFGGQSAEQVAKEKAVAAALAMSREAIAAASDESDRTWRAYLIAGFGSLAISGMAAFLLMRFSST